MNNYNKYNKILSDHLFNKNNLTKNNCNQFKIMKIFSLIFSILIYKDVIEIDLF
jgi:hypothetical protein